MPGWQATVITMAAIAFVVVGGSRLTGPLFRFISMANLRELFVATALMIVVGIALLMTLVGLSPALGTFVAGVVLANSEYRHELESDIDPFRGLLLGLFFITVGAGINFKMCIRDRGCRFDVPVWQVIYEELKAEYPDFEIISAAQDTGGEADAGPIFDAADVSYVSIVDVNHHISALYNLVNVPSGVWIDEEGRIVRINEGTYAQEHFDGAFGTNEYAPIVRDWVAKGADSQYIWDQDRVEKNIFERTPEAERAQPAFRLGGYYFNSGDDAKAERYWTLAQELDPNSWNYQMCIRDRSDSPVSVRCVVC